MFNYFFSSAKNFSNKFELTSYYLLLMFVVSVYIKDAPVITNIILGALLAVGLLNIKNSFHNKNKQYILICLGFILFYLYHFLSAWYSTDKILSMATISLRMPLLLLPLMFLLTDIKSDSAKKTISFFYFSTFIASLTGFIYGVVFFINTKDTGYLYNDNICHIIGKQSVYMAYCCVVAIAIGLFYINERFLGKYHKLIFISTLMWLLFYLFLLASKTAIFSLVPIVSIYIFQLIVKQKKYFEGVLIVMSIAIGFVVVSKMFPKIMNRFNGLTHFAYTFDNKNNETHFNDKFDPAKWNSTNTRMAIWSCVWEIWKENPIMGTGIGDRYHKLNEQYKKRDFIYALETHKNSHSEYLDVLYSMGIVGLILFLIAYFLFPLYVFLKEKNRLAIMTLMVTAICFVTENMFDRYQGLIFVPVIILLVAKNKEALSEN